MQTTREAARKEGRKKTIILQDNFHMMRSIITGKNVNHAG
jgi:uncharacterized SAM-binding protein YcdF (DUF218 family)